MGILNALTGGIVGALFGGDEPKQVATPASVQTQTEPQKTASEIDAENAAKKKAALIAANAGGAQATTVGGGNADVTRKVLLGL